MVFEECEIDVVLVLNILSWIIHSRAIIDLCNCSIQILHNDNIAFTANNSLCKGLKIKRTVYWHNSIKYGNNDDGCFVYVYNDDGGENNNNDNDNYNDNNDNDDNKIVIIIIIMIKIIIEIEIIII